MIPKKLPQVVKVYLGQCDHAKNLFAQGKDGLAVEVMEKMDGIFDMMSDAAKRITLRELEARNRN